MNKIYYNDILSTQIFQLGFYFVLFAICLLFVFKLLQINKTKTKLIILAFFALYNVFLVLDIKFNFIPTLPDASQYHVLFSTGRDFPDMSRSLIGFLYIIKFLRVVFIQNMLVYISFQVLLYFISTLILYKTWLLIYVAKRENAFEQIYFILALILPSAFLYHLVPLRECFSTLGFSIALYFLILSFKNRSNINFGFVGGLFIILMTRLQVVFYFIVSLMGVKFSMDKNVLRKFMAVSLGILLFIFVLSLTNYQLSPEKLAAARNYRVLKYSGSYGPVVWGSYIDIIISSPSLIAQFLFSPFPILHNQNPLEMKLIFLDALLMLFVWLFIIFNIRSWFKNYKIWLLLMLIYVFLFGIWEFNIGGAVRHRLPLSLMAIALASQFISVAYYNFNQKLNS